MRLLRALKPLSITTSLLVLLIISLSSVVQSDSGEEQSLKINKNIFIPPLHLTESELQEKTGGRVNIYFSQGHIFYKQSGFDRLNDFCELRVKINESRESNTLLRNQNLSILEVASKTEVYEESPFSDTIIVFKENSINDHQIQWLWCHKAHSTKEDAESYKGFDINELYLITGTYFLIEP